MTNENIELFESGVEDNSNNIQSVIKLLIDEIKEKAAIKKYLDTESGIDSSADDFMYYFHHSLSFMIHEIFGINITNYAAFPFYEYSAHEFFKMISDSQLRTNYFEKLMFLIDSAKKNSPQPCQFAINVTNPYKLHSNYPYQKDLRQKLFNFSLASQTIIELPSSNDSNFESFFSGKLNFRRLDFNLRAACVRVFFVTLHNEMQIKGSLIKCPKRLSNKFLCDTATIAFKEQGKTTYAPLDRDNFRKVTIQDCGSPNSTLIQSIVSKLI